MKNNNPVSHNRRSLRLKGHDYSGTGLYFITICTKDRQRFFGEISEGKMILNEIGVTADMYLKEVSEHFSHAMVAEHVAMPNHVHLILVLKDKRNPAGNVDLTDDGNRHGVGTCHGMSLPATGDGPVGTRHGVSPPYGVSPQQGPSQSQGESKPHNLFQPTNQFGKPPRRFGFGDHKSVQIIGDTLVQKKMVSIFSNGSHGFTTTLSGMKNLFRPS